MNALPFFFSFPAEWRKELSAASLGLECELVVMLFQD